jgi:hypothetical protein
MMQFARRRADSMSTRTAGPKESHTVKEFTLVCVWVAVGIMLTAAAVWFGFEVYGDLI